MKMIAAVMASKYSKLLKAVGIKTNLTKFSEDDLAGMVAEAKNAYTSGKPVVSDNVYDLLELQLRKVNPRNKELKRVGAAPVATRLARREKLPFYMGSMDKTDPNAKWAAKYPGPYVVSWKLDGISLLYSNLTGTPQLFTRGDGRVGVNVSHLIEALRLPKIPKGMAVRLEAIMPKTKFTKWSKTFANPRNMVAGITGRNDVHPALADVDVVAFDLLAPRTKSSAGLAKLKKLGFKVVPHTVMETLDPVKLLALLTKFKANPKYEMDGLIITDDQKHALVKNMNPPYSLAFKDNDAGNAPVVATVISIEWNVSRHGLLKPTILLKPIKVGGVTISRATGHNAKNVVDQGIGPGAVIYIVRSGDVIPYVTGVKKKAKPNLPEIPYTWDATKVNFVAKGSGNANQNVEALTHSISVLGVEHIKATSVAKLANSGYDTLPKLVKANRAALVEVLGDVRGNGLYEDLRTQLRAVDVLWLMVASNAFGQGYGERKLRNVLTAYPRIATMTAKRAATLAPPAGLSSLAPFAAGLDAFIAWTKALKIPASRLIYVPPVVAKGPLNGRAYLFTGVRDKALEEAIKDRGGSIATSAGAATHLVTNDPNPAKPSSKFVAMKKLNKPMILVDKLRGQLFK